jgi:hypothetical protein
MSLKRCFLVLVLFAGGLAFGAASADAYPPPPPPPTEGSGSACCRQMEGCQSMTDAQLLAATKWPTSTGMCFWHDREGCPTCACPYYVKLAHAPYPHGAYGGTGCVNTLAEVVTAMRQLCADGACCCPQRAPEGICPSQQRVWARDPITRTCCEYANPCLAPNGWPTFTTPDECNHGDTHIEGGESNPG